MDLVRRRQGCAAVPIVTHDLRVTSSETSNLRWGFPYDVILYASNPDSHGSDSNLKRWSRIAKAGNFATHLPGRGGNISVN